jgi:hypothetical protein
MEVRTMSKVLAITVILVTSLFVNSLSAQTAGCRYNGQVYPVGTKVGNLTCTSDGTWK